MKSDKWAIFVNHIIDAVVYSVLISIMVILSTISMFAIIIGMQHESLAAFITAIGCGGFAYVCWFVCTNMYKTLQW